jgi:hypothetical protein
MSQPNDNSTDRTGLRHGPRSVVWAWVLIGFGLLLLINNRFDLSGGIFLLGIGAAFLAAYASNRSYGFLVPGMILAGLGIGNLFEDLRMFGVWSDWTTFWLGVGFVAIYLVDRFTWRQSTSWPLWPGGFLVLFGFWDVAWELGLFDYEWWDFVADWWPVLLIIWGVVLLRRHQGAHVGVAPGTPPGGAPPPGADGPSPGPQGD